MEDVGFSGFEDHFRERVFDVLIQRGKLCLHAPDDEVGEAAFI
jgi:hypothetical protein